MPASYFSNFPYLGYSLNENPKPGETQFVTDIFRRVAPVVNLLRNTRMFYPYDIFEGETPESIADKIYGSPNYHWVVTIINNITDPLLDWPKEYKNLVSFIVNKYGSIATAGNTIHHYTMTLSKVDSLGNASEETFIIDKTKYDSLTSLSPVVVTFANGTTVTTTTTRATVDAYTYELSVNDAKRHIVLIEDIYIPELVSELEGLLT
jgi:hypothetical protein